jgi:hypothetical protein
MFGGPGQVPPDMSSPPVSTRVEPTVTHAVVTPSDGCHLTLTVPLAHSELVGTVDTPPVPAEVVTVTGDESGGFVERADVDGEEHPATDRLAATPRASRHIATPAT